jgi:hypothetical protein
MVGWADRLLLRTPFSPAHPSAPRCALHPSEHCFIKRAPGAKGCHGCETIPSLQHHKIFSVFFSFSQLVAGWKGKASRARVGRAPSERARSASTEVPPPSRPSTTATPSPLTRSIKVNYFDSLLNLIRFRCEIMWAVLDPYLLDTPSVPKDK